MSLANIGTPQTWGLLGRSTRIAEVIDLVEKAGASFAGVLVTGENGTGRGVVARAVHECGVTRSKPFVPVYCRDIAPAQAEAALFGKARPGPFLRAGRHGERVVPGSLVHQALGGTLYLRNVEELPDRVQARLAHLLRDGEVLVGDAAEPQPAAIRAMAAVGADYHQYVAEGKVRGDLHRRLGTVSIHVPPLRERPEDIPLLAAHFVDRACRAAHIATKTLTPSAQALLSAMPWRGNARELQGLMGSVVLDVTRPEIDLEDLLGLVHLEAAGKPPYAAGGFVPTTLREAKAQFEREYILAVLAQHHGRIPDAAAVLGIQRTNLYRKLRSLRIQEAVRSSPRAGRIEPTAGQR